MNSILYPLAVVVAWAAAAYKLPSAIRRPRNPQVITVSVALVVLGVVFAISTPRVWKWVDQAAGRPNLSCLLSQGCVMIWTVMVQILLIMWVYPSAKAREKTRKRLVIATASMAVMVVLFLLAPIQPEDSTNFAARYAGVPLISAYLCVYILAFAWMQGEVVYLCLRTIQVGGRIWLRRGLRATAAGAMLGLVYCLVRASDVVAATTGIGNPVRWEDVARLAIGIGVLLPPIGWTMPAWGPRLTARWAWAKNVLVYWRIYPLWALLYGTFAAKDMDPPQGFSARIALRDVRDWRLPRRLALIWDCMLELRPYRDPGLEQAAAASGDGTRRILNQRAAAEAAILLAALAAYQRNQRQPGALPPGATVTAAAPETATSEQLSRELDWLIALSRALKRRPRQIADVTRAAAPGPPG